MADFFRDDSAFTGGNGVLDPITTGNGQLVNVVVAVIGTGSDVNFRTDYWAFSDGPREYAAKLGHRRLRERCARRGLQTGRGPLGFCTFNDDGSGLPVDVGHAPGARLPAVGTPNKVLTMDVDSTSFAGFIHGFSNAALDTWVPQDWSTSRGHLAVGVRVELRDADVHRHPRQPESRVDDRRCRAVHCAVRRRLLRLAVARVPVRRLRAQGDRQRRAQRRAGPVRDARLRDRHARHRRPADLLRRRGRRRTASAEPPAPAVNFAQQNTFIEEGTTGEVEGQAQPALGPDDPAQVEHRLRNRALERDTWP